MTTDFEAGRAIARKAALVVCANAKTTAEALELLIILGLLGEDNELIPPANVYGYYQQDPNPRIPGVPNLRSTP